MGAVPLRQPRRRRGPTRRRARRATGDRPDAAGFPSDRRAPRRSASYEIEANWKLVVDNYLECYHCPVAHPGFSSAFDVDDYTLTEYPTFSVQRTPGREAGEGLYAPLWPNFTLNVYPGRATSSVNLFVPVAPTARSRSSTTTWRMRSATPKRTSSSRSSTRFSARTPSLCESAQRGLRSGRLERGLLVPGREDGPAHFQRLVKQALRGCYDRAGQQSLDEEALEAKTISGTAMSTNEPAESRCHSTP